MNNLRSCFFFFSLLYLFVFARGENIRTLFDIPSPRHHGGWVADPDGYLASSTKEHVDGLLTRLEEKTQNEVAIVVITKMKIPEAWWAESDVAHKFSLVLFDRWKIGKAQTNNGVLFLLAIEDRKMRIQTGAGAKDVLTDYECGLIIEDVRTLLRQKRYDDAVRQVAQRISSVLSGESKARSKSMGIMDIIFGSVIVFIIGLFLYGCYQEYRVRTRRTSFEKRLQKLKESEVLLPQLLEGEQCGICLEELKEKKTSRLKCKHMFHQDCIGEWLERKNSCPVCRVEDPVNMGPDNTNNNNTADPSTFNYSTGPQTSYDSSYPHNTYRTNFYFDNILDANQYLYRDVLPYYTFTRSPNNFSWRYNQPTRSYSGSSTGSSGFGGGSSSGGGGASGDW
eukprot:TRINITY_DN8490_c0_g1_i1.p1 TRINITY_DN8490_c0_g1~~TRINITY_DN8490_c0_g1_i1.p1  ORF type:complete len:394 (-),score=74.25 TRINITY_DN8490_c0_g1_i1:11-1192(-)